MRILERYRLSQAVKESFDNLSAGVCFFNKNGIAVLCNRRMHQLFHILAGHDLQNISDLKSLLEQPHIKSEDSQDVFLLPQGSAWHFSVCKVDAGGRVYTQAAAFDVTEMHLAKKELQEDNRRLAAEGERTRRLIGGMKDVIRAEEIVAAKIRVHKQVGDGLAKVRRVLVQQCPGSELDISDWRSAISLLKRDNEMTESGMRNAAEKESLAALKKFAAEMGVAIHLEGALPKDPSVGELLLFAVRECVTNVVRHAKGTAVYVNCTCSERGTYVSITNNGLPPEGKIAEHGGLGSLRERVEKAGGTVCFKTEPHFEMTVFLPKKEVRI